MSQEPIAELISQITEVTPPDSALSSSTVSSTGKGGQ
jgi:hypothetical protein